MPPIVLDGTTGITTPGLTNTGTETLVNLTTTGNTILGDASTDTLNVGNGGLIKDASGNVGVGVTPTTKFHVSSASNTFATVESTNGAAYWQMIGNNATNASYNTLISKYGATTDWSISGGNGTSGTMVFSANGSERARIDSAGNLGLGVTPSAWTFSSLSIGGQAASFAGDVNTVYAQANAYYNAGWKYVGTGYAGQYQIDRSVTALHKWFTASSGTAGNAITFTQAMTLTADGNLGVGTTSPSTRLHVKGASAATSLRLEPSSSTTIYTQIRGNSGDLYLEADPGNAEGSSSMLFTVDATERARIDSSGNLLVGTTSLLRTTDGYTFAINAGSISGNTNAQAIANVTSNTYSCWDMYSRAASAYRFYVGWGGTVYATSTTISAISDQRLKENIRDLDDGLASVMALKPRKFDWKEGKGADIKNARGFIAQEFETVFPDLIDEWRDPAPEGEEPYKSVRQDLIPTLVKAIQEQQAIIQSLTARITALENK